ncbi:uncharacterized protein STEHIDRAFT_159743 [Stereum hirsutum FP-91666 SS1]|uniref:uncharacterized protein n=1 Tax=Stereum hirsutum (strain FP-91666) TaxID=721885 RepID=UPI000444989C|nr:uncharacterized protein STEHIDRAFT_159743 [Stereum hirsutum FP-91666 SS1]EIM84148.1 hypothetical protein STEHIDRAFT_159743 [Stereum hirsutum FP-91666 SS1]
MNELGGGGSVDEGESSNIPPISTDFHRFLVARYATAERGFSIYQSMLAQVEDSSSFSSSDSATQISSFSLSAPSTQPSSFSSSNPRAQLGSASLPEYLEKGVQVEVKDLRELLPLIPHERLMGTEASQKRFDWERRVDHILGLGPDPDPQETAAFQRRIRERRIRRAKAKRYVVWLSLYIFIRIQTYVFLP